MTTKVCRITECGAQLLGMSYHVLILEDGSSVAVCPSCRRKIGKINPQLNAKGKAS